MKILHVANFSLFSSKRKRSDDIARYYATDRKISNGLIRNGHCVWDFSYRDAARHRSPFGGKRFGTEKMNTALLTLARQFAPDLILLGHCELLTAKTLAALREDLPNCRLAQWWVDWFADDALPGLRAKLPYLHTLFTTSGTTYVANRLSDKSNGSDGERLPPLYYLPNIVDSSVETERAFAADKHDYDLFFAGADAPERTDILRRLEEDDGVRCGFFGFDGRPHLGGAQLATVIGNSKMGLNLSRTNAVPLYSSDRLAQLTGNGCLTLMPQTPEMTTLFNNDEVVYYADTDELLSHLARYNKDDAARRKIAMAGWQRAHTAYNERRVTRFIIEAAFAREFGEVYEWVDTAQPAVKKT